MARRPRWIRADAACCEVQPTVDRQFFFKPDDTIRNIVGSAVGRAQEKYPVKLYWIDFNINHKHTGRAPISGSPVKGVEVIRTMAIEREFFDSSRSTQMARIIASTDL